MRIGRQFASRHSRRGSVLMVAMGFVIAVSVAGTVLLSLSYMHQVEMQGKALAVRMMAAAEAGIESKRGRFTLIQGVQDDWLALLPSAGWNNIDGPMSINGLSVQVQAMPTGTFSVPKARVRGVVTTAGRRLAVEYEIRVAAFSDYSVFSGSTATYNPGVNYKSVGNHYSRGDIFINSSYTGVEFFGRTETSGTITSFGSEGASYNFKKTPSLNVPIKIIPSDSTNFGILRTRALGLNYVFRENTLRIQLNGNGTFTRTFVRRRATAATGNSNYSASNSWINCGTNTIANPGNGSINAAALTTTDYDVATQTLALAAESVIYIEEGLPSAGPSPDVETGAPIGAQNNYVQPVHAANYESWGEDRYGSYTMGWITGTTSWGTAVWVDGFRQFRKVVQVQGTLGVGDRVTVAVAGPTATPGVGNIMPIISNCIRYQSYMTNPALRAEPNKQSAAALAVTEMFGLISACDVNMAWEWWTPLSAAEQCPPGPLGTEAFGSVSGWAVANGRQYCLDGTFLALNASCPGVISNNEGREYWLNGGNIGQALINSGLGNIFSPNGAILGARHYDWDWRMNDTTPPYFLRTYNTSATYVTGSWRSYEF